MPTCVRGQGIALVNVMSMISQMASPYIVYSVSTTPGTCLHCLPPLYSPLLQAVWSEKAPFLITGLLSLLGAVPGLFLPETADLKMPDTLEVSLRIAHCNPHTVLYYLPSESCRTSRSSAGTTGCCGCRCAAAGGGSGAA